MAWAYLITNFVLFVPGMAISARLIEVPTRVILTIFFSNGIIAALMACAVKVLQVNLEEGRVSPINQLALCVLVGAIVYTPLAMWINRAGVKSFANLTSDLLMRRDQ